MKALSVRQPRAEQILRGDKRMDVRTWYVAHRGPLAIHASAERRPERIRALGFDPAALVYGAVLGIVDLVNIVPLDEAGFAGAGPEHLSDAPFPGEPCFGWRFERPRRLTAPLAQRGKMGLFAVPDAGLIDGGLAAEEVAGVPADPARPFVLYALPDPAGGYRVALYQWPFRDDRAAARRGPADARAPGALWSVELGGDVLRAVSDGLMGALRANGYRPSALAALPKTPFYLDETSGLRLALLFLVVKPLAKFDRIEQAHAGVRDMGDEEAYYWFSKCSSGPHTQRAQKALRVLLAGT